MRLKCVPQHEAEVSARARDFLASSGSSSWVTAPTGSMLRSRAAQVLEQRAEFARQARRRADSSRP
jgi:hypothetical protein